jgi:nucleoid-associated protein YgaU
MRRLGGKMDEKKFQELKGKYQRVIDTAKQQNIHLEHVHEDQGKLVITGAAPSDDAKNRVWDQIKAIDANYRDVQVDIRIDPSIAAATQAAGASASGGQQTRTYTVKSGDSLSKISQQFYGSANEYMKIFEANRDKLSDPNRIQPGQELVIP